MRCWCWPELAIPPEAVDLFLVDPSGAGVELEQKMSISSDTQYTVTFDGAAAERVGAGGSGWATWSVPMVDAMILAAAYANGGCEHALDITVEYSKDRYQFGKALAEFQALVAQHGRRRNRWCAGCVPKFSTTRQRGRTPRGVTQPSLLPCRSCLPATPIEISRRWLNRSSAVWDSRWNTRSSSISRAKQLQITWNDTRRCEEIIAAAVLD